MHIIAAKAVALKEAASDEFEAYQTRIVENASSLADELTSRGLRVVSGGTDNHVFLLDVTSVGLNGKIAEKALEAADITVNKNTIPYDPNPPLIGSGIRLGTAAVSSRDMGAAEMATIGGMIAEVLADPEDDAMHADVGRRVHELVARFPLYG